MRLKRSAKLKATVLVLLVAGAFAAVSAASASAVVEHFYVGGVKIGSTPTSMTGSGSTFVISSSIAGVGVKLTSTGQTASGTIFNEATGEGTGMTPTGIYDLTGMTVNQPGCLVHSSGNPNGTISVAARATAETVGGVAGWTYSPVGTSGGFGMIEITNCTNSGLNGTYVLSGTFFGVADNAASTIVFNTAAGDSNWASTTLR